ncbi:hypothetical protein SELMODRAFT_430265 [Selaginella moellendorffii]|uniref:Uncharacterized protein n=1 Tax=Selaginella moellendorffii TaxID=88036 RepID=D8T8V9_SELML|nr:hypothetical protein SELMODRAFT_430265 [Selaginella moellendorffii]
MVLVISKDQVTPELLESVARDGYNAKIVSANDHEEELSEVLCLAQISTPLDMDALRVDCRSGIMDILLPEELIEDTAVLELLEYYQYTIAQETRAILLGDHDHDHAERNKIYCTRAFDEERLELKLHCMYNSKRTKIEVPAINYAVRYKSFVVDERKQIQETILSTAGMPEQKLGIGLCVDIFGSNHDHPRSILMRLSTFCVGISMEDFLDETKHEHLFGFFPDSVKITIQPLLTSMKPSTRILPCFITPDQSLSLVPDYQIASDAQHEYRAGVSVKIPTAAKLEIGITRKEADNSAVRLTTVSPVNVGDPGVACIQWKMNTWANKKPYHCDKPHKAMTKFGEWPKLPYLGTGPQITGVERIQWQVQDPDVILDDLRFEVTIETRMVLLRKEKVVSFCGLGEVAFSGESTQIRLVHKAEMKLMRV